MFTITTPSDRLHAPIRQKASAILFTHAVASMPLAEQLSVRETAETLNGLDEEDDRCDEHDFGEFEVGGEWYCWKIDLDDPALELASDGAPEPDQGTHVMTILFADEYWQLKSAQLDL
jgi:hypothetical protein